MGQSAEHACDVDDGGVLHAVGGGGEELLAWPQDNVLRHVQGVATLADDVSRQVQGAAVLWGIRQAAQASMLIG